MESLDQALWFALACFGLGCAAIGFFFGHTLRAEHGWQHYVTAEHARHTTRPLGTRHPHSYRTASGATVPPWLYSPDPHRPADRPGSLYRSDTDPLHELSA